MKGQAKTYESIINPPNLFRYDTKESILEWLKSGEGEWNHKENVLCTLAEFEKSEMYEFCSVIRDYLKTLN